MKQKVDIYRLRSIHASWIFDGSYEEAMADARKRMGDHYPNHCHIEINEVGE